MALNKELWNKYPRVRLKEFARIKYLTFVGLFSFDLIPFGILGESWKLLPLLVEIFLLLYGLSKYWYSRNKVSVFAEKALFVFYLLMLLSSFRAALEYDQSIIDTLVAQRHNLMLLFFLLFSKMNLTLDEIELTFKNLSIASFVMLIVAIFHPELFATEEAVDYLAKQQSLGATTDVAVFYPGLQAVLLYLFLYSRKVVAIPNRHHIIVFLVLFLYIIICQNRSSLLAAAPLFLYVMLKAKYRYKILVISIASVLILVIGLTIISGLVDETQKQLENPDYNRWQAISFFIVEFPSNIITVLIGHGVPCSGSPYLESLLYAQETRLAFIHDIGLLGTCFYYGLFMIAFVLYFIFKGSFGKKMPMWLRIYSLWWIYAPWIQDFATARSDGLRASFLFYIIIAFVKYRGFDKTYGCFGNNSKLQYSTAKSAMC
jgi:hypothetical protein